jgi:hypothetical protein
VPTEETHLPLLNTLGIAYTTYGEFVVWQWGYHGNFMALISIEISMDIQDTIK